MQLFHPNIERGLSFISLLHFGLLEVFPGKLRILLLGGLLILAIEVRPPLLLALGVIHRQDMAKIVGLVLAIRQQFCLFLQWTLIRVTQEILLELGTRFSLA